MKRSTGVALVVMGAAAVGGTAYWVSSRDCSNVQVGTAQAEQCRSHSGSSYYGGRSNYWSHQQSSSHSSSYNNSSNSAHPASAPAVARSGFGSTSHGFSSGG